MAFPELPSLAGAEGDPTTIPVELQSRDNEPLFTLTLGDIQAVAREELGRELTDDEAGSAMDNLRKAFDWAFYVANSIQAGQKWGKVGAAAPGHRGAEDGPDVGTESPEEFFDIYASLSRDDLERSGFDTRAVTDMDMHHLAREMTSDYMKQHYWSSLKRTAEHLGIPRRP